MIHQVIFVHPRPDWDVARAQNYWVDRHAPTFAPIPQIRAYLVAPSLPTADPDAAALGMGTAEVWLENFPDMLQVVQSERFLAGRSDEPNFTAFWRTVVLLTDDHPVVEGPGPVVPAPAVKLQVTAKRRSGLGVAAFRRRCLDEVGVAVSKLPGLLRHVQCHVLDAAYEPGEPTFDGLLQLWFDSAEAAARATASDEYATVQRELDVVAEPRYVHTTLGRERWLVEPGSHG